MQIRFNMVPFALRVSAGLLALSALSGCAVESTTLDDEELAVASEQQDLDLAKVYGEKVMAVTDRQVPTLQEHYQLAGGYLWAICGLHPASTPASFSFDDGTSQGWETVGMFDGDSSDVLFTYGSSPAFFWDRTNAFAGLGNDPVDGNGSALAAMAGGPGSSPSGWARFDFRSPDVSSIAGWQGKASFTYSVLEAAWFNVYGQLVLEVQKCDGSTAFLRETDSSGDPVFCALNHGSWTTCNTSVPLSNDIAFVKRLHVRLFGPAPSYYEGGIYLDEVRAL